VRNSARISYRYPESDILVFVQTESLRAAVRATQRSVGDRVTFTWMTFRDFNEGVEESKERTEEEISDLEEIAGPHLCSMIAQESPPVLSTGSLWASLFHILLNRPFDFSEYPT
jgi:hypothetical protein